MRIIGGEFRSRRLEAPRGWETRPTSDRLRETLFNVLQPREAGARFTAGARFLDLYAGSGANGLEALSRGAAQAVFVEQAAPALEALRKNVVALGLADRALVQGMAVRRWLAQAARASASESANESGPAGFDIIFLDPPYADAEEYRAVLGRLGGDAARLVAHGGVVIAEHRRERNGASRQGATPSCTTLGAALAQRYGTLSRTRTLEQGDAALSFFMHSE